MLLMKITLDSGRVVTLSELHQRRTYAGLLAGKPDRRLNLALIEETTREATSCALAGADAVVFAPPSELIASRLPAIACVAVFHSGELRGGSEPYTSMTFVWWQEAFGAMFPACVQQAISAVDWESRAQEWCP
jgi:hypothetical protein